MANFTPAPTYAAWAPTTSYTTLEGITTTPANGYVYASLSVTGLSGASAPAWPTTVGATVADGAIVWECVGTLVGTLLAYWDLEQAATINGDLGGCWAPTSPIVIQEVTTGGAVQVNGPTQITNDGELLVEFSASIVLGTGDFPRNGPTHLGRNRRLVTSCMNAMSNATIAIRPDFAISALDAVACSLVYYTSSASDSIVTVTTTPVQWQLPLDVHNGAIFADALLTYRANLGTPKARVIAVSAAGAITPLTSTAIGADANGYVTAPGPVVTETVQSWTIPIDGGVAGGAAVVSRDSYSYLLQVVEDQTQTEYPGALPVLTPVYAATTGQIDLANAPTVIDGLPVPTGARVLVKNQFNPEENGIYLYPGTGKQFPLAYGTPVPQWQPSTAYVSTGVISLVQPVGPSPGIGLYFKCTSGGTSGTTQPLWPLATGAPVTDGGVTWTCEGGLQPYAYSPVVELRTYGLLQGSVVQVTSGISNALDWFQYQGSSIAPADIGSTPTSNWATIPFGLSSGTTTDAPQDGAPAIFAAQGNAYHGVACDFTNINTQEFQ